MNSVHQPYDKLYLTIMEDYITLYHQGFLVLGCLKEYLEALAMAMSNVPSDLFDAFIDETNELEIRYAIMLDDNRTTLSEHERESVQQSIASIIALIEKIKAALDLNHLPEIEATELQDLYNCLHISMMEDYMNIYRQGFINLKDLTNNLEALASAVKDFSSEMTVQAVSQIWCHAIVYQATSFETIYTTMLKEKRTTPLEPEQQLVNDSLAAITRLIAEYKTNFRECLKEKGKRNRGTGIVTAPFRK